MTAAAGVAFLGLAGARRAGAANFFCGPFFKAVLWLRFPGDHGGQVADKFVHLLGLGVKFFGRGRGFLGVGGILLGDLVHFGNRNIDLADAVGLFLGGG